MVKIFLKSKKGNYNAIAEYDASTKKTTVLKGSRISSTIASGKFRSARSVKKQRENARIKDHTLAEDVVFKSSSSAANFVTGKSTNGLLAWKTESGMFLKKFIEQSL